jgi:hypothetical protein
MNSSDLLAMIQTVGHVLGPDASLTFRLDNYGHDISIATKDGKGRQIVDRLSIMELEAGKTDFLDITVRRHVTMLAHAAKNHLWSCTTPRQDSEKAINDCYRALGLPPRFVIDPPPAPPAPPPK